MGSLGKRLANLEDRFGMRELTWEQAMEAALEQVLTPAEKVELARPPSTPRTEDEEHVMYSALGKWGRLCETIPFRPQGNGR